MQRFFTSYLLFWIFCTILIIGGVFFFFTPKQTHSEQEKRTLAATPRFEWTQWWSKQYANHVDEYIADHFPYRETWLQTARTLKQSKGVQDKEVAFVQPVILPKKKDTLSTTNAKKQISPNKDTLTEFKVKNTTLIQTQTTQNNIPDTEDAIYKNGILIYKNMALQFFGGNESMAKYFAKTMNEYHSALSPKNVTVHCVVPPSSGAFYIPEKYRRGTSEKDNLDCIRKNLNSQVHMPKVYEILEEHKDEYIYFNTDHHWTGLGAYYAYQAFCQEAGIDAIPLENMQRKVIPKFLGSLYYVLQDERLQKGMDSVVYYKINTPYRMYYGKGEGYKEKIRIPLYAEYARGGASYGVFIGSDHPYIEIDTDLNNGRRAIVLKNSYGNPFVPYLVQHFDKIIALDYRYYDGKGVKKLVDQYQITDVIIITTSVFANVAWHSDRLKIVLNN